MVSEIRESAGGNGEASGGDMERQAGDPAADVDDHFGVVGYAVLASACRRIASAASETFSWQYSA